ncbi:MAG: hypothetical protein K0R54_1578 [Clostridiaceae bacterium]|nr:hypothetical protein [Clostridiaceae bacterium]
MKVFLIILVVLLLVPLPIKVKFKLFNTNLYLYIYRFKIDISKNIKKYTEENIVRKRINMRNISIIKLLRKFNKNPVKPYYYFTVHMDYGFDDAAATGLFYGFIYSISPLLYKFLSIFLNIKKYNFSVKPHFNKTIFNLEINSIFLLNIVNVICIIFLILSVYFNTKKVNTD